MRTAADPIPKLTELRIEALHADGSRVYLTYLPERDGTLEVEVGQRDGYTGAVLLDGLPPGSLSRGLGESNEHQVQVKGVAFMRIERLVRDEPGR